MDSSFFILRVTDCVSAAELDLLFDRWLCLYFIAGVPGSAVIRGCGGHWLSSVRSHKITAHERTTVACRPTVAVSKLDRLCHDAVRV